jgi:cytochrome P450
MCEKKFTWPYTHPHVPTRDPPAMSHRRALDAFFRPLWGDTVSDFVPERWINAYVGRANNIGSVRTHYSNLTSLHGPRSCIGIGEKFAKSELKALMAVFVGTFQMEIADPNEVVTPAGAITTKPRMGGFFLKVLRKF